MTRTLRHRSAPHVPLATRLLADDRRSPRPVDALRVRLALARPVDREFADRLRAALSEHHYAEMEDEVSQRLRML